MLELLRSIKNCSVKLNVLRVYPSCFPTLSTLFAHDRIVVAHSSQCFSTVFRISFTCSGSDLFVGQL